MQSEFADRFGRRWRVELEQLHSPATTSSVAASDPEPRRPGLSLVLFSADGLARWSTWIPFRSIQAASDAAEDLDYLDRMVEELYYRSTADA